MIDYRLFVPNLFIYQVKKWFIKTVLDGQLTKCFVKNSKIKIKFIKSKQTVNNYQFKR